MKHKYVRHSTLGVVIFPADTELSHKMIARAMSFAAAEEGADGKVLSAGFVVIGANGVSVDGRSESLNLGRQPDDAAVIVKQLGRAVL